MQAYYDQDQLWDGHSFTDPAEQARIEATLGLLPADAESALDVGCGNGAVLNRFPSRFRTVGVDFAMAALRHVRGPCCCASVARLPFADRSFDLVTSFEVIEHLPDPVFGATLAELVRTARRYVLVSVPNRENLIEAQTWCPRCRTWFHRNLHVRSFTEADLRYLHPRLEAVTIEPIGPERQRCAWPPAVLTLANCLRRRPFPRQCICPLCGFAAAKPAAAPAPGRPVQPPGHSRRARRSLVKSAASRTMQFLWRPVQVCNWLAALYRVVPHDAALAPDVTL